MAPVVDDNGQRPVRPVGLVADDGRLLRLACRIAVKDRVAFAELYDAVSAQLLDEVRSTVSGPDRAASIVSATFVEAWSLARFHTDPGFDIYAWLCEIAHRRAAERFLGDDIHRTNLTSEHNPGPRRRLWWPAVATSYDRQTHLALAALLDRPTTP